MEHLRKPLMNDLGNLRFIMFLKDLNGDNEEVHNCLGHLGGRCCSVNLFFRQLAVT